MDLQLDKIINMYFNSIQIEESSLFDGYVVKFCSTILDEFNNDSCFLIDQKGSPIVFNNIDSAYKVVNKIMLLNMVNDSCINLVPSKEVCDYQSTLF